MTYKALIFGAIGTLAETSEVQRHAYNLAFRQSGLDWDWDEKTYLRLLERPGGVRRIAEYAEARDEWLDAPRVHARKVANFRAAVLRQKPVLRPGVAEAIRAAKLRGMAVAWVTTTGRPTLDLMFEGLAPDIREADFDYVCDRSAVDHDKPAPDIYHHALSALKVAPEEAIAIEDTPESARAAIGAGLACIAFPGEAARHRVFPFSAQRVSRLSASLLAPPEKPLHEVSAAAGYSAAFS